MPKITRYTNFSDLKMASKPVKAKPFVQRQAHLDYRAFIAELWAAFLAQKKSKEKMSPSQHNY